MKCLGSIATAVVPLVLIVAVVTSLDPERAQCNVITRIEPRDLDPVDHTNFVQSLPKPEGEGSSIAWPKDYSQPITFTLKADNVKSKAVLQILMGPPSERLNSVKPYEKYSPEFQRQINESRPFNCFVDRSAVNQCKEGRRNPRCCYPLPWRNDVVMSSVYPVCESGCAGDCEGDGKTPCSAVCYDSLLLQIEFTQLGDTIVSALYKQLGIAQTQQPEKYHFNHVLRVDKRFIYSVGRVVERSSTLNDRRYTGYWVRWVSGDEPGGRRGPFLEIGRDGQEVPYMVVDLAETCFDCFSKDQFGWSGLDVRVPLLPNVFQPKFWYLSSTGAAVDAGLDCKNVIFSRYQDQPVIGGKCILHYQCSGWCQESKCLGRTCEPEEPEDPVFSWAGASRICEMSATSLVPNYSYILLILLGVILGTCICLVGFCLFYVGSTYPRKTRGQHRTIQAPKLHTDVEVMMENQTQQMNPLGVGAPSRHQYQFSEHDDDDTSTDL